MWVFYVHGFNFRMRAVEYPARLKPILSDCIWMVPGTVGIDD